MEPTVLTMRMEPLEDGRARLIIEGELNLVLDIARYISIAADGGENELVS